jgi:hypothetical protein
MTIPERHLDSAQRQTLEHLYRHPTSANIKWPQVLALLKAIGDVTVESKDRYRVTVNHDTEVFQPPHLGDIPADMAVRLREILKAQPRSA